MNRDAQKEIRERQLSNLFGELSELIPVFENKELTDIFIYGDGSVRAEHFLEGRIEFDVTIEESTRYNIIHYLSAMSDSSIDTWANPTLEGILPEYNFRVTAVLPPGCGPLKLHFVARQSKYSLLKNILRKNE